MPLPRFYLLFVGVLICSLATTCVRDFPATAPYTLPVNPKPPTGGLPSQEQPSAQKRLFIANDKVRLGIDLNMGGAITWLTEAGSNENMINNPDLGRQLQTAIYSGPIPYNPPNGKQPVEKWKYLGWNPVQAGDYFNHPARIVSYQQGQNQLYVKSIPLIWPLFDEPAECTFEHWIELRGNSVHVRARVSVNRPDTTQYEARTQETPCVYLNGPYYRMVMYTGAKPFTNDAVTEYTDREMLNRYSTENWVALLNESGRGVGLYKAKEFRFKTAGFGIPKVGGEFDVSSGYMNSDGFLVVDYNGQYEFEYDLVLGSVADIRQFAYSQPRPPSVPDYYFVQDRQGWYYYNTHDRGWPIRNELNILWERNETGKNALAVKNPLVFWRATDIDKIYVQAAFRTNATSARLGWRKPEDPDIYDIPSRYVDFPIIGDGQYRTYEVNLKGANGWDNVINQIQLSKPESQNATEKGSTLRLRSVTVNRPNG